ncbi:MAG TPA: hypothetical protein VHU15_03905 [Stellaceae bacterium]|jgi:hypothetical protein|nr:hypothetical protein [Stellaceae bacterium]
MRRAFLILALAVVATASRAQSVEEIDRREAAVVEAWQKTPLTVRRAVFVAERPHGFGQFVERQSNVFKPGEKLVAYVEPVGFGWKEAGDGKYQFGFDVDFLIKEPDGKILAGQENFAKLAETSQRRNREFMVTLTMNVSGAPPGDYVLEYKLRDIAGDKSAVIDLPFKIAK